MIFIVWFSDTHDNSAEKRLIYNKRIDHFSIHAFIKQIYSNHFCIPLPNMQTRSYIELEGTMFFFKEKYRSVDINHGRSKMNTIMCPTIAMDHACSSTSSIGFYTKKEIWRWIICMRLAKHSMQDGDWASKLTKPPYLTK